MNIERMKLLREKLCRALEEMDGEPLGNNTNIEKIYKITGAIHRIDEIMEMGGGSSQGGGWHAEGTYSHAGSRMMWDGDPYSNRGGMMPGNYGGVAYASGRDGYSNAGGRMVDHIEALMMSGDVSAGEKETLRRMMERMR